MTDETQTTTPAASGIFAPASQNAVAQSKPPAEPIPMESSQAPADSANKEAQLKLEEETQTPQVSELDILKARAKLMSITFSPNIGLEALRQKINEKLNGPAEVIAAPNSQVNALEQANQAPANHAAEMVAASVQDETQAAPAPVKTRTIRQMMRDEQMKLVRLRITCLDPKAKDLTGEVFTVANEYLGTVRKFIPYGEATENGYHVPYCLYKALKERKFLSVVTKKDQRTGANSVSTRWVPTFALEILPPLTEKEMKTLATAQIAAGTVNVGEDDE